MKYTSISENQMEIIEKVLSDWTSKERGKMSPRFELVEDLESARFRAIDIPRMYNSDEPWKIKSKEPIDVAIEISERLERDAMERQSGFGFPPVVETSTDYNAEREVLELLHNDVVEVVKIAHEVGWTLNEFTEDGISLCPAEDEHTVDSL